MILATVGTHHQPFDRLVDAVEAWAAASGEEVVLQRGPSERPAPHCEVHDWLAPRRLDELAKAARVVVTHAGPGSVLHALGAGAVPVVLPRDPVLGEHVDDHQQRFARHLRPPVVVVWDATRLRETLQSLGPLTDRSEAWVHDETSRGFARGLDRVIGEVTAAPRPRFARRLLRALRGRKG